MSMTMARRVIGLDLSLSATGVATPFATRTIGATGGAIGMERLQQLRMSISTETFDADLVVVEGYSFGTTRQAGQAHSAGELGGVVRLGMWETGTPYVDVAPALLKKFATGVGNAKKDAVLVAAVRAGYAGDDNNEADAWWLRQMGLYHLGLPEVPITLYRTEAVHKVTWPTLDVAGVAS